MLLLAEAPTHLQVMIGQIHAGLWRRNGEQTMGSLVNLYKVTVTVCFICITSNKTPLNRGTADHLIGYSGPLNRGTADHLIGIQRTT